MSSNVNVGYYEDAATMSRFMTGLDHHKRNDEPMTYFRASWRDPNVIYRNRHTRSAK